MAIKHEIYLAEKAIGDLLWNNWEEHIGVCSEIARHREFEFAGVRPDFLMFSEFETHHEITVVELKITANTDSIRQVCAYLRAVKRHVLDWTFKNSVKKDVKVGAWLVAKNIDREIEDLCHQLDIFLLRVRVKSKTEIETEIVFNGDTEHDLIDPVLTVELSKAYGVPING